MLKNHSKTPLHLLKWYTPLEGIGGDIFDIIRDGQPIPYLGILATRGNPSPESYVLLEPGESAYAEINLTSAYDFSQPGTYTIKFRAPRISHLARSEAEMARTLDELGPVYIPSNEVSERMIGSLTGIGLPVRRTTDEVRGMIEAYPRDQKPDLVEELTLPVEEISTEDAWEALQTQIFRVSGGIFLNESYLIRGFEVIQLGTALGGQGLTSLVVSDLDQDGQAELLFIYSFGSGLHQSHIGMFAPAYDGIGTSEEDMGYLGDLSLSSEDRSHIGVRVLEAVPDSLKLRCLDTIGYLSIEQIDMREGLVLKIYKLPPDEILEKLITTR